MVTIIMGIISIFTTLFIVGIPIGDNVYRIGFLPGLILSVIALCLTYFKKDKTKVKASYIVNGIALGLSLISLLLSIIGGFVVPIS